jgi:hypothetical protein
MLASEQAAQPVGSHASDWFSAERVRPGLGELGSDQEFFAAFREKQN